MRAAGVPTGARAPAPARTCVAAPRGSAARTRGTVPAGALRRAGCPARLRAAPTRRPAGGCPRHAPTRSRLAALRRGEFLRRGLELLETAARAETVGLVAPGH